MVLFNIGAKAWDATCQVFGLPHMIVGSLPATSERIFSSGNERTMALFNPPVRLPSRIQFVSNQNVGIDQRQTWISSLAIRPIWYDYRLDEHGPTNSTSMVDHVLRLRRQHSNRL